jgi:molybdopterin converting factor small subunit
VIQKIREWADAANGAKGVAFGFSMSFTDQTARQVQEHDPFKLEPEELVGLFRYRYTAETQKKRKKEALDLLKEEFEDLDSFNAACSESFPDWDAALEDLMSDKINQQECKAIRRQAFKVGDAVDLVPQTPNLILIPLKYAIASGNDESESNKALRRLYVALLLSIVFDAAVSIRRVAEISDWGQSGGAAYVPPVPAIRSLIRKEWINVSEARYWLSAIGAASVLARDTALPARSALYQSLCTEPAEKLLRRIDEKGRPVTPLHLKLISKLPGFHAGQLQGGHA